MLFPTSRSLRSVRKSTDLASETNAEHGLLVKKALLGDGSR